MGAVPRTGLTGQPRATRANTCGIADIRFDQFIEPEPRKQENLGILAYVQPS